MERGIRKIPTQSLTFRNKLLHASKFFRKKIMKPCNFEKNQVPQG